MSLLIGPTHSFRNASASSIEVLTLVIEDGEPRWVDQKELADLERAEKEA